MELITQSVRYRPVRCVLGNRTYACAPAVPQTKTSRHFELARQLMNLGTTRYWTLVFSILATKKLLDRVKRPVLPAVTEPTPALGNWYATAVFWRPQVALLVNERTLFPVLMPLAPAATLMGRFPASLEQVLEARNVPPEFIEAAIGAMGDGRYARTASRSVVGSMNEFVYLAESYREHRGVSDLTVLSLILSATPCGPLRERHGFPDRELDALVSTWLSESA